MKLLNQTEYGRFLANSNFYEGAKFTRERKMQPVIAADSKQVLTASSRTTLLSHARKLVANVGIIRGAIRDNTTYSVGTGLTPQSQVKNTKDGDLLESYFDYWGNNFADLTGRHTFNQLQALASQAIDVDGDIGFAMYSPNEKSPGQLQVIEGHRITSENAEKEWIDGVLPDKFGRPINYRIKEGSSDYRSIDTRDFIFLNDPDRVDQYRGVTSLVHAINHGFDILDIIGYEKVGVKMASAIGVAIKTANGFADAGSSFVQDGFTAAATGGLAQESWQAGMIPRLKIGESIESFASNRPSQAFMGFLDFLIRDIAAGLGLPFEFVWNLSMAKGSGSRFILAKAQRRFEQRQALLVQRLLNRVWVWVIAKGIKRREIPAIPGWWNVRWQAPCKITMDMGKEAQANRDDLKYGNRTLRMDASEQGLDWVVDLREQIEVEKTDLCDRAVRMFEKYKAYGMTFEKALWILSQDGANAPVLPPPPTEPPATE